MNKYFEESFAEYIREWKSPISEQLGHQDHEKDWQTFVHRICEDFERAKKKFDGYSEDPGLNRLSFRVDNMRHDDSGPMRDGFLEIDR